MADALINEVLNNALKDAIDNWKQEGLSDEEILAKIDMIDFKDVMMSITDTAATDFADFFRERMYEIELEERAKTQEFSAHQEQLWGKCFAASQTMYTLTIEAAENISKYIDENANAEDKEARKFVFLALQHLHGRACQMFLEILTLLRNGFGDCAYARWRSLYELNCTAYFIKSQGEQIAKQYYEQSQSCDPHNNYDWTKGAVNKRGKPITVKSFAAIETYCEMGKVWNDQYKLACLITHGSPEGAFKRMSIYETRNIIPVGRSNYGIAVPAEHSAISLHLISTLFFTLFPYADSIAYVKTLGKWVEVIQEMYYSTEEETFPQRHDGDF
jgi:hypothetical protein